MTLTTYADLARITETMITIIMKVKMMMVIMITMLIRDLERSGLDHGE